MNCSRCQEGNPAGARFCNACGTRLEPAAPAAAPQTYTPKHLAERILTSRPSIEGERKQVTVLFADVKGSMELLADRDPEEARELLDAVVERMMEAVHRYDGTVNQVMGDGIMALFGAPLACEDHAVRACFAALRMQEEFGRYAEELRRTQGIPLHIRIGLNSGEVVVRSISNDLRMDYSAVGQTTHLAARMEQMAEPGCAFITGSTLRLAGQSVAVKPLGPRPVKGLDAPIEIFELVGATPVRSIARVAAVHRSTRFVARTAELAQLQEALEQAQSVSGRAVGIVGEAGVGKSRLIYEFISSQSCRVLGSCALSYENAASWAPVIDLLRSYFDVDGGQHGEQILAQVSAKMRALDSQLEGHIAPILSLLGALPDSDGFRLLDARDRKQRLLSAQTRLLLAQSECGPLVLVFENLQWIDEESRAFLDALMAQLPRSRLLLVMNYRAEFEHDWKGREGFSEISLEPLSPSAARELLRTLLGEDRSLVPVHDLLIERSNGNPFFLEEIVRTLVETKAIVGEAGAWRLVARADGLHVPPTVQAVIAARIDRLPREEKLLLQQASVIGTDVPLSLLEAVTEVPDEVARRSLRSLQAAGFIHQTSLFPDLEYRFRHILTREVAYATLLKEQRRALHARSVAAIETLHAERLAAHLDDLAVHAVRGELWDKAVTYNRQLGMRAQERAANPEAVTCFEEALRALARLPSTRETTEAEFDLRSAVRPALLQLGRLDEVLATSKQLEQLALQLGDQQRLARAYTYLINYHYLKGETALTIDYGARCIAIAQSCEDTAIEGLARQYMGQSYHARGEYRLAERELERNVNVAHPSGSVTPYVSCCSWLAFSLAERGEFETAARYANDAQQAADASGHVYNQMIALSFAGLVALRRGHAARAVLPLQRSFEICRKRGLTVWHPVSSSLLGLALMRLGTEEEGLRLLEDSVAMSRQLGVNAYLAAWMVNLAEGQLAAGQSENALATAQEALALAVDGGERGHEAHALWLLGSTQKAVEPYEQALGIALGLEMLPLAAQTHLDVGRQFAMAGDKVRADRHASLGRQLLKKMDMRPWYDQSQTSSRETGHLYIVARSNPQLYEFLTQEFSDARGIKVVLDRRERGQRGTGYGDDRRHQEVDADLRTWDLALMPAGKPAGTGFRASLQ
jgi:class 3 adenylate cyclase/tetratricopeptide (TPR) repeat protein